MCTGSASAGNILDLKYNFNLGSGDNGNVMGITNDRDTTRTQSFTYDNLNRITTGKTSSASGLNCWGEAYTIDQWGNLTNIGAVSGYTGCTQESLSVSATANNQLSSAGYSYDLSGNMLTDKANTYAYNAESEIKSAANTCYTYDGDGNRLEKRTFFSGQCGAVTKSYWYGAGTEILDEMNGDGGFTNEYVFCGGKRIAMRNVFSGVIYYYAEDMLGSSRTIVQAGQTTPCYDGDFYPFGGERIITNTCSQNYKFEGKERDTESGNDDFGARYYSSRLGRWLSADWSSVPVPVPYANLSNPQTLNLYAMVSDNPETFADLDGHACGGHFEPGTFPTCESEYKNDGPSTAGEGFPAPNPGDGMDQSPAQQALAAVQQQIANVATGEKGSTAYQVSAVNGNYTAGTDKCNELVADAIQKAGAPRPQVPYTGWKRILSFLGIKRDPTAHEWADPGVKIPGWSSPQPLTKAAPGAVIAQEHGAYGHVGIVVGPGQTVSANTAVSPAGLATRNAWGFRPRGQNGEGPHDPAPVVRLYIGDH